MRAITTPSRHGFADTVSTLQSAITTAGHTLFATLDQAAAAKTAGLEMKPLVLLVFGNPKGGTPLMVAHPEVALCLPLKLVVAETAAGVVVIRDNMAALAPEYGVPAGHPALAAMDHSLETLAASAA